MRVAGGQLTDAFSNYRSADPFGGHSRTYDVFGARPDATPGTIAIYSNLLLLTVGTWTLPDAPRRFAFELCPPAAAALKLPEVNPPQFPD